MTEIEKAGKEYGDKNGFQSTTLEGGTHRTHLAEAFEAGANWMSSRVITLVNNTVCPSDYTDTCGRCVIQSIDMLLDGTGSHSV